MDRGKNSAAVMQSADCKAAFQVLSRPGGVVSHSSEQSVHPNGLQAQLPRSSAVHEREPDNSAAGGMDFASNAVQPNAREPAADKARHGRAGSLPVQLGGLAPASTTSQANLDTTLRAPIPIGGRPAHYLRARTSTLPSADRQATPRCSTPVVGQTRATCNMPTSQPPFGSTRHLPETRVCSRLAREDNEGNSARLDRPPSESGKPKMAWGTPAGPINKTRGYLPPGYSQQVQPRSPSGAAWLEQRSPHQDGSQERPLRQRPASSSRHSGRLPSNTCGKHCHARQEAPRPHSSQGFSRMDR